MNKKTYIITIILILLLVSIVLGFQFRRGNNDVPQLTQTLTLNCTSNIEQNLVAITSLGCPKDEDNNGYIDENAFDIKAENKSSSVKYLRYISRTDGSKEYLKIDPYSLATTNFNFGSGVYRVDDISTFSRDSKVVDALEIGDTINTTDLVLKCQDIERGLLPYSISKDEKEAFGWKVALICEYEETGDGKLQFVRSKLEGSAKKKGVGILVYELTNKDNSTIVYQNQSALGFVYPNTEQIKVSIYQVN